MINETDSTIDSELLAHIDGALSPPDRAALDTRLAGDPALKARLSELAAGSRPFAGAYEVLLRDAPHERLRAAMDRARTELEARQAQRPRPAVRRWLQPLAAAVA